MLSLDGGISSLQFSVTFVCRKPMVQSEFGKAIGRYYKQFFEKSKRTQNDYYDYMID